MVVVLCGLSGAGKTTLVRNVKCKLEQSGLSTEIIDGDEHRDALCRDPGCQWRDNSSFPCQLIFILPMYDLIVIQCLIGQMHTDSRSCSGVYI